MPFDPKQPFDIINEFDPNQPFEKVEDQQSPKVVQNIGRQLSDVGELATETTGDILESLKDIGLGAAQGATLGFADELAALAQAPFSERSYRELQKEAEEAALAAAERSPWLYGGGEVLGGLTTAIIPGLGAAGGLAKTATLGQKALQGAKLGALAGGITGAGQAKGGAGISDIASDVASGAVTGGTFGALLPAVIEKGKEGAKKLAKSTEKLIEDTDWLRALRLSKELGEQDITLNPAKRMEEVISSPSVISEKQDALVVKVINQIKKSDESIAKSVGNAIEQAEQAGLKMDITPELGQFNQGLIQVVEDFPTIENSTPYKWLTKALTGFMDSSNTTLRSDLSPRQLHNLKGKIGTYIDKLERVSGKGPDDITMLEQFRSLGRIIDDKLKTDIPEYKKHAERLFNFRRNIHENIIAKGEEGEFNPFMMSNVALEKRPKVLKEGIEKNIVNPLMTTKGESTPVDILRTIKKYSETSKDFNFDDFAKDIRDAADLAAVQAHAGKKSDLNPTRVTAAGTAKEHTVGTGQQFITTMMNRLELKSSPVHKTVEAAKKVASVPYKIGTIPEEQLLKVSQKLKTNPSYQKYGDMLEQAIVNKDELRKNQALFVMLQNPNIRGLIGGDTEE